MVDGSWSIRAKTRDSIGNESEWSSATSLTISTKAPEIPEIPEVPQVPEVPQPVAQSKVITAKPVKKIVAIPKALGDSQVKPQVNYYKGHSFAQTLPKNRKISIEIGPDNKARIISFNLPAPIITYVNYVGSNIEFYGVGLYKNSSVQYVAEIKSISPTIGQAMKSCGVSRLITPSNYACLAKQMRMSKNEFVSFYSGQNLKCGKKYPWPWQMTQRSKCLQEKNFITSELKVISIKFQHVELIPEKNKKSCCTPKQ